MHDRQTVRALYRKLLNLYPREFRQRLGQSMEQSFHDLYLENRRKKKGMQGFMFWIFIETSMGIVREHVLLIKEGNAVKNKFIPLRSPAIISLFLILPFTILELVNRRGFNEDFPFMLFFVLWLNLFAIGLILLPIVGGRRARNHTMANSVPEKKNTLLTNPRSALMISVILFLFPVILSWLNSLGLVPLERLLNGTNPEQPYLPGQVISLLLISIPIAAGIIAGRPIVSSLQAGGSLLAHPFHLLIVVVISFLLAAGAVSLILDQWPCFLGVPNCD